jgi:hypothetical protein
LMDLSSGSLLPSGVDEIAIDATNRHYKPISCLRKTKEAPHRRGASPTRR